jgi:hypothetical protein
LVLTHFNWDAWKETGEKQELFLRNHRVGPIVKEAVALAGGLAFTILLNRASAHFLDKPEARSYYSHLLTGATTVLILTADKLAAKLSWSRKRTAVEMGISLLQGVMSYARVDDMGYARVNDLVVGLLMLIPTERWHFPVLSKIALRGGISLLTTQIAEDYDSVGLYSCMRLTLISTSCALIFKTLAPGIIEKGYPWLYASSKVAKLIIPKYLSYGWGKVKERPLENALYGGTIAMSGVLILGGSVPSSALVGIGVVGGANCAGISITQLLGGNSIRALQLVARTATSAYMRIWGAFARCRRPHQEIDEVFPGL